MNRLFHLFGVSMAALSLSACASPPRHASPSPIHAKPIATPAELIVQGARDQLTWGTGYDPSYVHIPYPGGDVPRKQGVCTDVVIRALRHAGYDLQVLIHEDMKKHWADYPRYPDRKTPDPNIDHRRVPNQAAYFRRHAQVCTRSTKNPKDWQPGDIVEWKLPTGRDHTGILTDHPDPESFPYVIHNIGNGPQEEDVLRTASWRITAHFRLPLNRQRKAVSG